MFIYFTTVMKANTVHLQIITVSRYILVLQKDLKKVRVADFEHSRFQFLIYSAQSTTCFLIKKYFLGGLYSTNSTFHIYISKKFWSCNMRSGQLSLSCIRDNKGDQFFASNFRVLRKYIRLPDALTWQISVFMNFDCT